MVAAKPRRGATIGRGPHAAAARSIAERRMRIGLTQRQLADLSEVSDLTVRQIEKGQPGVRLDSLIRVLDVLGLALLVTSKSSARALEASKDGAIVRHRSAATAREGEMSHEA